MNKPNIPIRNIFYLLAYAWDHLEILDEISIGHSEYNGPSDFFARLLITSLETARKLGLSMGYISHSEFRSSPKGKFELSESLKTGALQKNFVMCSLDDLTFDVIENQIIKATFISLIKIQDLDKDLRDQLRFHVSLLNEVSDIIITPRIFRNTQVRRGKSIYKLIINVCELVHLSLLPEEHLNGDFRLTSFLQDERSMPKLFECFIRNFYRREQSEFPIVGAPSVEWDLTPLDASDLSLLPSMLTDTTLESSDRVIIIETKFYPKALVPNRWGIEKIRSQHLYQLMSYVSNKANKSKKPVEGILLYPTVSKSIMAEYLVQGHKVRICTIDLSKPWNQIEDFLFSLINCTTSASAQNADRKFS